MAQVAGNCGHPQCPLQHPPAALRLPEAVRRQLADAYAAQSQSDFEVYQYHLSGAEECHRLHYLQMACEKIAKAYQLKNRTDFEEDDLYSHVAFSKVVENLLKSSEIKQRYRSPDGLRQKRRRNLERYARALSKQIEKLAPAVDRLQTPANVEYPWMEGERVFTPCLYPFSDLKMTDQDAGEFIKLIKTAIYDYEQIVLNG